MERLTEHHVNGKGAYMKCSEFCELEELDCARCEKSYAILDRLAAYEDTGLEPEEIVGLCEMEKRGRMANMEPILFNTDMVRAILDGRKTVTRRVVKPQHLRVFESPHHKEHPETPGKVLLEKLCEPPYRPGEILYVRETWCDPSGTGYPFLYKADMPMHWDAKNTETGIPVDLKAEDYTWHPSIHMPKEAARLFLRVKEVRVERLQDIDDVQACEEGAEGDPCDCDGSEVFCSRCCNTGWITSPRSKFAGIWDSTIKPADLPVYGWAANPWVWVIEFERVKGGGRTWMST